MLKNERQAYIMDLIKRQQYVRVIELKDILGVSDETIRRDLIALEQTGQIHCVHGGAVYDSSSINEYAVSVRMRQHQAEKEAICREAATLIKSNSSMTIAASTTVAYLGDHLAKKDNITLVTNSVILANRVSVNGSNKVILVGGEYWVDDQKSMGQMAASEIGRFNTDVAFISVSGISIEKGMTEYKESEMEITRAVMKSAKRVILLNDYTKFDIVAFRQVAAVSEISDIVTDWRTSAETIAKYEALGIKVHVASRK